MAIGTNDILAKFPKHHSYSHLARAAGGSQNPLALFLAPFARQSAIRFEEDFLSDVLDLEKFTTGETGSGTPFAKPATEVAGGVITGVTGATSGNAETIYGNPWLSGDNNCWVEMRLQTDVITTLMLEVGLFDSASSLIVPLVNDIDTPSLLGGTSDAAVLCIDTSQTLTTMALVTDGSTTNMNTTATTVSPAFTPTAAVYHNYLVGIAGDIPFAMIDGIRLTQGTGVLAQRVEGGALLRFWHATRTRTTAAKTTQIDYIAAGADRAVRTA